MHIVKLFVRELRDPEFFPRLIVVILLQSVVWIAILQGINSELWSEDPQLHTPVTAGEPK